jgi:arginine-tRNA-protein transferase
LAGELSEKLDKRSYVSLSRDRSSNADDSTSSQPLDSDVNEEELSLFDIHMPGVLTMDEVKALDLDHWHLLYHGTFVQMIVSFIYLFPLSFLLTFYRISSAGRRCP